MKAWDLSIDRLERRSEAVRLLQISSVMVPEISFDLIYSEPMVERMVRDLYLTISEPNMVAKLVTQIDDQAVNPEVYRGARQIQVHRVFQTIMQERMSAEKVDAARRNVDTLFVAACLKGDVDDPQKWQAFRLLWPHVRPSQAERSNREDVRLPVDRIRYLRQRDDLGPGRRRAQHIEDAWEEMLAAEPDPDSDGAKLLRKQLYRLRFNLANILRDLGEFKQSQELDEAVLRGQEAELGDAHPHTLQTRSSLAADLRAQGRYRRRRSSTRRPTNPGR